MACLLLSVTAASAADAQVVHGVAVDQSGQPVAGVVMQLLDSLQRAGARSLTNERGEFWLSVARPGTYRIRSLRIGFRPLLTPPRALTPTSNVFERLVLAGIAFSLDTVRVVAKSACRSIADSSATSYAVWEQARTALLAAQLTAAERNLTATTMRYERSFDADGRRMRSEHVEFHSDSVREPWRAVSPDSLHRGGYVVKDSGNFTTYYAPGLDMLVSDQFIEDHCLRLVSEPGRLGIAFEPNPERERVIEIRGTIWLDRASAALSRMEYQYANLPPTFKADAGGALDFARFLDGAWAISQWSIRMPVFDRGGRWWTFSGSDLRVVEVRTKGGALVLATHGRDTVWSQPPRVMSGMVVDSTTGAPVAGAHVSVTGTNLASTSDERGRFVVPGILPGKYVLQVRTPALDSMAIVFQNAVTFTDERDVVEVRVPNATQAVQLTCASLPGSIVGVLVGTVRGPGGEAASAETRVKVEWVEAGSPRTLEARIDRQGAFRVCGVPTAVSLTVSAVSDGGRSDPVVLYVPAGDRLARVAPLVVRPVTPPSRP